MSFCNSLTFFRIRTSAKTQPISNVIWHSHGVHLVNINVYAKFHQNIQLSSRDSTIITFSEFGARQSLDQWKMSFAISWARSCQYQCLRNSLSKYSIQFKRKGHFHFFRIWRSEKPRPMINVILWFLGQIFSTSNCLQNFIKKFRTVQEINSTFFRTWTSAKSRSIPNIIWQSHGLHLVNTSVYAKFNHNIPFSSRDRAIFTFSEFGARQSLDRW